MLILKRVTFCQNALLLVIFYSQFFFSAKCDQIRENKSELQLTDKVIAQQTKKDKKSDTVSSIKVTFIEFGSLKCIPCKMMQPVMKEVEEKYGNQVNVIFYDVWTKDGKLMAPKYELRTIPMQVFLDKDGNEYFRHNGYFSIEEVVKILEIKGVDVK
jgi:thioredoxin 1